MLRSSSAVSLDNTPLPVYRPSDGAVWAAAVWRTCLHFVVGGFQHMPCRYIGFVLATAAWHGSLFSQHENADYNDSFSYSNLLIKLATTGCWQSVFLPYLSCLSGRPPLKMSVEKLLNYLENIYKSSSEIIPHTGFVSSCSIHRSNRKGHLPVIILLLSFFMCQMVQNVHVQCNVRWGSVWYYRREYQRKERVNLAS